MGGIENISDFRIDKVERALTPISVVFNTAKGLVGEETLRLDTLQATESVSQPFEVQLEMRGDDFSLSRQFTLRDFLGRPATAEIVLPDADTGLPSRNIRYFNGIVSQFTLAEDGVYRATLKPTLWRASLTNHYHIYPNLSIEETLKEVLHRHQVQYETHLGSLATSRIQDWLQAGETDLDFMQRLMEKANIYYYFIHEKGRHVMVLANRPAYRQLTRFSGSRQKPLTLRYTYTSIKEIANEYDDLMTEYQYQQNFTSSGVDYLLARSRAAWEPHEIDRARYSTAQHSSGNVNELPFQQYKVFQYGGGKQEASEQGEESWDKLNTAATSLSGSSTSALLCPGHRFSTSYDSTLPASPEYQFGSTVYASEDRKVRANLENEMFVVTQVQHKASATELYSNSFQATEATGLITPFNIQSTQQGTILGIVEAYGGAVEPTDWRYLEKNNFDFENNGFVDSETPEKLNCIGVYVRFITNSMHQSSKEPVWVKLSQTMQTVPEVGVVVMVSRSNDESEVPEIQGIVESHGSKVIMPHRWTANTSVGSSYSTSYGDSKGVRYGLNSKTDLKSAVNIVESAYATRLYKDCSFSQGASYGYSTSENGKSGLLSKSESFGNTESEFSADYTRNKSDIGYTWSESTIGRSDSYSTVTGKSYSKNNIGEQETDTTVDGNSKNTNHTTGNNESSATTIGNNKSTAVTVGNSESYGFTFGNSLGISLTVGAAASVNTYIGLKSDNSIFIGGQANSNIFIGLKSELSVFVGGQANINVTIADNTNISMNLALNDSLSLSVAENNSMSMSLALNNSLELSASMNNTISATLGLNNAMRLNAAVNNEVNVNAVIDNKTDINLLEVKTKTTPLEVITEAANVKCRIGNMDVEIMTMKIFI